MKPFDVYFILTNVYLSQAFDNSAAIVMGALNFGIALFFYFKEKQL